MTAPVAGLMASLKDALAVLPGLAVNDRGEVSCRVGLESNMTPADYPMIRIVPSKLQPARTMGRRRAEVLVYFGTPVHEFEDGGLEGLYAKLFDLEEQIIALACGSPSYSAVYLDTVMDEDRSDVYKLMALRFDVEG